MIVYSTRLLLTDSDARGAVQEAVRLWLEFKLPKTKAAELCREPGRHELGDNSFLEVQTCDVGPQRAYAVRYGHLDRDIQAREWLTEVGVIVTNDQSVCSVLLHTRDQSTRVQVRPETTRPFVVGNILKECTLRGTTPGGKVRKLTAADTDAFGMVVRDPDRFYPIVQVSPLEDGAYPVDPRRLSELLVGTAEVASIPENEDTFALSDALGSRFSAYHGAVNVLWPVVERDSGLFVPSTRLLADDLERAMRQGRRPERDILELICHHTNPGLAREHLSPERVQSMRLRAALDEARKAAASSEDGELRNLMNEIDVEQKQEIENLKKQVDQGQRALTAKESEFADKESELRQALAQCDALKIQLQRAGGAPASGADLEQVKEAVPRAITDSATLEDCLAATAALYPDRLTVLDSAWASARKARGFNAPRKAFELLSKLCTDYYDAMIEGRGDREGAAIFGKSSFAARESETVENNKRARELRRFTYKEETVEMMRHLKIGVKDSVAETFRAHFLWDADAKRIVLGHCGKHLDHG